MILCISSSNSNKIKEIKAICKGLPYEVKSIHDLIANPEEVIEDGDTFQENAIKKIMAVNLPKNTILIGDDSGLEVAALNGAPGIHSARYAGPNATATDLCNKLLLALKDKPNRSAQFRTVIAIRHPHHPIITVEGMIKGIITQEIMGKHGFGYDPVFIPEGHTQTFAQMTPQEKNTISHRTRALSKMKDWLQQHPC